MTPEQAKIHGEEARQLLDNHLLKLAFVKVEEALERTALECRRDDKENAQGIIVAKQMLQAVKREIHRVIQDGDIAKVQLEEIQQRKKLFRR